MLSTINSPKWSELILPRSSRAVEIDIHQGEFLMNKPYQVMPDIEVIPAHFQIPGARLQFIFTHRI